MEHFVHVFHALDAALLENGIVGGVAAGQGSGVGGDRLGALLPNGPT